MAKEYLYENATKEGEPYQKLLREQDQKIDETRYTGGLKLHESRTFVSSGEELIKEAGTDGFIRNNNKVLGTMFTTTALFTLTGGVKRWYTNGLSVWKLCKGHFFRHLS